VEILVFSRPTPTTIIAMERNRVSSDAPSGPAGVETSNCGKEMDKKPKAMSIAPRATALREPSQRSATIPPSTGVIQTSAP